MTRFLATWKEPGEIAVRSAWSCRELGGTILDAIEQGLADAELHPDMVAIGLGSLPNTDGQLELDASIMDGSTMEAGAVCAVRDICPIISLARLVMERTPHVMIAGEQARRFAIECGITPRNLHTAHSIEMYEKWRQDPARIKKYVHSIKELGHDTVTMIGFQDGHLIAASSTSGLPFKMPGRVGDSPIIGAGIYADNEIGAAGATGNGEELWKAVASFRAVENMRQGMSPQEACDQVIRHMLRRQVHAADLPCVVFAMAKDGTFAASATTGEFELWSCTDGQTEMHTYGVPA